MLYGVISALMATAFCSPYGIPTGSDLHWWSINATQILYESHCLCHTNTCAEWLAHVQYCAVCVCRSPSNRHNKYILSNHKDYSFTSSHLLIWYKEHSHLTVQWSNTKNTPQGSIRQHIYSWSNSCLIMYRLIWCCWELPTEPNQRCMSSSGAYYCTLENNSAADLANSFWSAIISTTLFEAAGSERASTQISATCQNTSLPSQALMLLIHASLLQNRQASQATLQQCTCVPFLTMQQMWCLE